MARRASLLLVGAVLVGAGLVLLVALASLLPHPAGLLRLGEVLP